MVRCMTATLPEEFEYKEILSKMAPTAYKITLDRCVKLGFVSPYKITCIPVKLTKAEREDYKKVNNSFVYNKYQLGQFDAFNEASRILKSKTASGPEKRAAVLFWKAIRDRKSIIDYAENKIKKFKSIYYKNTDKKILVFGGANVYI